VCIAAELLAVELHARPGSGHAVGQVEAGVEELALVTQLPGLVRSGDPGGV
jgi:hypothetical protein